jgi:hypothetical protein
MVMPVSSPGSVSHWLGQLKAGNPAGGQELWQRYFQRLAGLEVVPFPVEKGTCGLSLPLGGSGRTRQLSPGLQGGKQAVMTAL